MSKRIAAWVPVGLLLGLAPGAWGQAGAPLPVTAFVGVNVIPGDSPKLKPNQTVLVRGGRIAEVGPAARVKVPDGAARIDGTGKFLMPGIAEMHGHLPDDRAPESQVNRVMTLFVAAGVTTVRGMQGAANQIGLRDKIARGQLLGPRLFLYGPPMTSNSAPTVEVAVKKVEEQKKAGYDGVKILEAIKPEVYEAIARTARRLKMPFGGHVPNAVGLERALAAGQKSIDHLDGFVEALLVPPRQVPPDENMAQAFDRMRFSKEELDNVDEKKLPRLIAATRRAGAMVVPTMAVWKVLFGDATAESLRQLPEMKYIPELDEWADGKTQMDAEAPLPQRFKLMEVRARVLAGIARAGGLVMLGADAPQLFSVPGFSLRNETQALVKAGMTPAQVVEAATIAPARYLGVQKESGSVAAGKRADLILVDGNPLEDVANIFRSSGVMVNGRWLPRTELDALLAPLEKSARAARFPAPSEVKDLPVAANEAASLTGTYKMDNGVAVQVSKEKEGLTVTANSPEGSRKHRLLSQGGGRYLIPPIRATVTFEMQQGRASKLVFSQRGNTVKGARAP
jgi:imidazolonepropionase-like amidohydrolase